MFKLTQNLLSDTTQLELRVRVSMKSFVCLLVFSFNNRILITRYTQIIVEAQWPNDQCIRSRSERSGFEPWLGTLCCVLGQDT